MNLKKLFNDISNPSFLRRLDRYLLLNQPVIWGSRLHYVAYYGLLVNLFLTLIIVSSISSQQIDEFVNNFTIFIIIFEVPVFFFWMFRQSIFDVDKQHGQSTAFFKRSLLEMTVYAFCFCIIFSPSVVLPTIAIYKTGYELKINQNTSCLDSSFSKAFEPSPNYYVYLPPDITKEERKQEFSSGICSDIQYITTGVDTYTRYYSRGILDALVYHVYLVTKIIVISTVCWPFFIVQKYSNWSTIAWFGLCLTVIASITIPAFSIFNSSSTYFLEHQIGIFDFSNGIGDMCLTTSAILLLSFLRFIVVLKGRCYSSSSVISFGISLLAINILLMFLLSAGISTYDSSGRWISPLFILLVSYFLAYPFYKKLLVKNLFLPREK